MSGAGVVGVGCSGSDGTGADASDTTIGGGDSGASTVAALNELDGRSWRIEPDQGTPTGICAGEQH